MGDKAEIILRLKKGLRERAVRDALYHANGLIIYCQANDQLIGMVSILKNIEREIARLHFEEE